MEKKKTGEDKQDEEENVSLFLLLFLPSPHLVQTHAAPHELRRVEDEDGLVVHWEEGGVARDRERERHTTGVSKRSTTSIECLCQSGSGLLFEAEYGAGAPQ